MKSQTIDEAIMHRVERDVMLQVVDTQWKDHLYGLDHLKEGISLRGYGQRNPLVEYKRESFAMFQAMKERMDEETIRYLWRIRPVVREPDRPDGGMPPPIPARQATPFSFNDPGAAEPAFAGAGAAIGVGGPGGGGPRPARVGGDDAAVVTVRRDSPKVGRNDPCPCGSGKKYKKCHGA